ncbi:MAG: penicillin-binding protein 2 [Acetobacterales bacterium]
MHNDQDRFKLFTRRASILAGGQLALVSALVGRLYYLQVLQEDRYRMLADENRISLRLLPPPRGRILDREGVPLAVNSRNYRVLLVAEQSPSLARTLDALGRIIPIGEHDRRRIEREVRRKRPFVPVTVAENLGWEQVAQIEVNAPDLPGISIDVGQSRFYPYYEEAAHVIGYVAAVAEEELTGDPVLELPGFRIGKSGIEREYDGAMRGKAGTTQLEVNALGRVIRELKRQDGQPGDDVELTLDIDLQRAVSRRLGNDSAAAVVMDVRSGEVLAMSSTPSFDPNSFNQGISSTEWRALSTNMKAPLINKPVSGQYAPGSTFKMIVALAGLEAGLVAPDDRFYCRGWMDMGNARFHCWKRHGHGWMDMHEGIKQSCDVYFYELAKKVGIARIGAMSRRFGLGGTVGIDLPGEQAGLIPTREWKMARVGTPWQRGETVVAAIGQGYILTTPLQLAVMSARLATGRAVTPRLTRRLIGPDGDTRLPETPEFPPLGLSEPALAVVRDAMDAVTNHSRGTAYRSRIAEPEFAMAGKTGTAQVRRITRAERLTGVRKNEDLEWRQRDHALFVAFAPVKTPRYAAAVVVEHGGSGSTTAAPIVRDILLEAQRLDPGGRRRLAGGADGRGEGG